jgi:hypothetical protein
MMRESRLQKSLYTQVQETQNGVLAEPRFLQGLSPRRILHATVTTNNAYMGIPTMEPMLKSIPANVEDYLAEANAIYPSL